jgi:hypothetical protein
MPTDPFETAWNRYPRKVGKKAARKAFEKLDAEEKSAAVEMSEAFGEAMAHVHPANRCFIPHFSTWLNQGRWDDDPAEWVSTARELERPRR